MKTHKERLLKADLLLVSLEAERIYYQLRNMEPYDLSDLKKRMLDLSKAIEKVENEQGVTV